MLGFENERGAVSMPCQLLPMKWVFLGKYQAEWGTTKRVPILPSPPLFIRDSDGNGNGMAGTRTRNQCVNGHGFTLLSVWNCYFIASNDLPGISP